jgi:hypothetical protein
MYCIGMNGCVAKTMLDFIWNAKAKAVVRDKGGVAGSRSESAGTRGNRTSAGSNNDDAKQKGKRPSASPTPKSPPTAPIHIHTRTSS